MFLSLFKKYVWLVNLILIVAIAYVVALAVNDRIGDSIYSPSKDILSDNDNSNKFVRLKTTQPNRAYYEVILTRNIFGIDRRTFSDSDGLSGANGEAPKTNLNIELLGTHLNIKGNSIAVIKNSDSGKINGYSDGDIIDIIPNEKVKLLGVENCKAIIDRKVRGSETIYCNKNVSSIKEPKTKPKKAALNTSKDEKGGIKQLSDDKWMIERKMLNELLDDPSALINQARVVPQKDGLRFFGIRPSSIFFKIGLRNGDTVHKINEVELSDVQNALGVFSQLKNENDFSIDFTRRGKKLSYAYDVN
jgi:general secretion pathway protein C